MNSSSSTRYDALDVFRGMTVAGMIIVNNPGSWSHVFQPLTHSPWNGCTPTDLVFPFFLFCAGVAMAFSLAKCKNGLNWLSLRKLFTRGLLIFLVGFGLNAFPFFPIHPDSSLSFAENYLLWLQNIRILGVLQMIGLCYIAGGVLVLWLKSAKNILIAFLFLLIAYWIIMRVFGGENWMTLEGNFSNKIDNAILGENHLYHAYGIAFEPEGILRIMSATGTVLLGYLIGLVIRGKKNSEVSDIHNTIQNDSSMSQDKCLSANLCMTDTVSQLYTIGLICLATGCILDNWFPINKPLWTSSFVLYTGGLGILILSFFIYFLDIKNQKKLFIPFKALGMNPLICYVGSELFSKLFNDNIRWSYFTTIDGQSVEQTTSVLNWFYRNCCVSILGNNEYASLMYALVYVSIFLGIAMWLYKKKIVIKL